MGLFMRHAVVANVDDMGGGFRLITLEGPALRNAAWTPGHKIQIAMGSTFATRTYTPLEWDAAAGRTRILGYAHGAGPGSEWLVKLTAGAECDIFGPRRSLAVEGTSGPLVLFGDETSMGLAHALRRQARERSVLCQFEVSDVATAESALAKLDVGDATLVRRERDGQHLYRLVEPLSALAAAGATFVLTGHASSIQQVRQQLRRWGVPAARMVTKAYWATGKAGLD
ncbi:siderophore-interacting protein [Sphingomonas hankookensis]|uniref:siderophore-interacting protein n=1 Tax=Sphingomonas hankookensis TaxID=563996 RepID=UPI001F57F3E1|nr:siderophore-interacting protein [Sphingomonas hankookensis]